MDHSQLELTILNLGEEEDQNKYRIVISNGFRNPYYYLEYLLNHKNESNELIVFLLKERNIEVVLMPILINKIPGTEYFDAKSPYGYHGPLFKDGFDKTYARLFWKMLDQWYLENKIVTEFIRFSHTENHLEYSGDSAKTLMNVCGSLKRDFEEQWKYFGKKVRNNYRKAQSFNLDFKLYNSSTIDKEIIDSFYKVYYKTMLRNNASKFLYFSANFFQKLVMAHKEDFTIGMAYHEELPISTELHIHYKGSIFAFLGGTDSDFFHMRPNDFLRVEVIKWAIENDKRKYILGGGIKNNDGLYKSKKAFFPNDKDCIFYTGRKVVNEKMYNFLMKKTLKERPMMSNDNSYFPLYRKP